MKGTILAAGLALASTGCILAPEYTSTTTPTPLLQAIQPKQPVPDPTPKPVPVPNPSPFPPPIVPDPTAPTPNPAPIEVGLRVTSYGWVWPDQFRVDPTLVGAVFALDVWPPQPLQRVRWDYGDGGSSNGISVTSSHNYQLKGDWTVTAQVDTQDGQHGTARAVVHLPQHCQNWPTPGCIPPAP